MNNTKTEVTMADYMDHLGIKDPKLLEDFGIRESKYNGNIAVEIPYFDTEGYEVQTKIRTIRDV